LTQLALWCRARLDEIKEDIDMEGISSITESLIKAVTNDESQIEHRDPPSPVVESHKSTAATTILPSNAGGKRYVL
jgi:hypothetical protein